MNNVPISDFATSRILPKRCVPGLRPCYRGLAQKMLHFNRFPVSKHVPFHSDPRIQPYAMILKWRRVRWPALWHCEGGRLETLPYISDFGTSRILQKRCCPGLHPYYRGLAQKMLNFITFPFSKHVFFQWPENPTICDDIEMARYAVVCSTSLWGGRP